VLCKSIHASFSEEKVALQPRREIMCQNQSQTS